MVRSGTSIPLLIIAAFGPCGVHPSASADKIHIQPPSDLGIWSTHLFMYVFGGVGQGKLRCCWPLRVSKLGIMSNGY